MLAFLSLANILVLNQIVQLSGYEAENQELVWLVLGVNAIFALGFGASAYGLWRRLNWGRVLFLWCIVSWAAFNIGSILFSSTDHSSGTQLLNSVRFVIGPLVSLWYLNLDRIKTMFDPGPSEEFSIIEEEEV